MSSHLRLFHIERRIFSVFQIPGRGSTLCFGQRGQIRCHCATKNPEVGQCLWSKHITTGTCEVKIGQNIYGSVELGRNIEYFGCTGRNMKVFGRAGRSIKSKPQLGISNENSS